MHTPSHGRAALRVDGPDLALNAVLRDQRRNEKLGKAVQCRFQVLRTAYQTLG